MIAVMLGKCWENVGNMLGTCWEFLGKCWEIHIHFTFISRTLLLLVKLGSQKHDDCRKRMGDECSSHIAVHPPLQVRPIASMNAIDTVVRNRVMVFHHTKCYSKKSFHKPIALFCHTTLPSVTNQRAKRSRNCSAKALAFLGLCEKLRRAVPSVVGSSLMFVLGVGV